MFSSSFFYQADFLFHVFAQAIDEKVIDFVDMSFKTLHFSASAFEMLQKFQKICTRDAINNHLMKKFDDILAQYCREVLFLKCKEPIASNATSIFFFILY